MARKASGTTPSGIAPAALPASEPEDDGRLLRVGGDRGLSLSERVTAKVNASLYKTPLHRLRLRGRFPLKLLGVPVDPVPGDAAVGERIVAGRLIHAGHTAMTRDIDFGAGLHPPAWRDWSDSWAWLRDLSAHVGDRKAAAALAEPLVTRWLARFEEFDLAAWRPDVTGRRLLFAFGYAPLILSAPDQVYRSALLSALATWARHLDRAAFRMPDGVAKAEALAGLYAAGVLIPGGEARAGAALAALDKLMGVLVAPDGGVATRAPVDALALAQLLVFAGNCSAAISVRPPPLFADTLARLVPSLKGLALGDGVIGGWHGGGAIGAAPLEVLTRQAATGNAMSKGGRWSGYHRLSAGKTVLVVDAGPPPPARVEAGGHAGTLAFEMSDGAERIITNCGGARGLKPVLAPALAAGLRTTAAHSTLTIADTNSTRIRPDRNGEPGALGLGVEEVTVQVRASEQGHWLEAGHDGYAKRFAMLVERRLFLSPDGQDLRGEDVIVPAPKSPLKRRPERDFTIRFHLGAGIAATPTADGAGALLKLANGRVWAMKTRGGRVGIEQSLWVDPEGALHKTQQLVISARTDRAAANIGWSFKRAGK